MLRVTWPIVGFHFTVMGFFLGGLSFTCWSNFPPWIYCSFVVERIISLIIFFPSCFILFLCFSVLFVFLLSSPFYFLVLGLVLKKYKILEFFFGFESLFCNCLRFSSEIYGVCWASSWGVVSPGSYLGKGGLRGQNFLLALIFHWKVNK